MRRSSQLASRDDQAVTDHTSRAHNNSATRRAGPTCSTARATDTVVVATAVRVISTRAWRENRNALVNMIGVSVGQHCGLGRQLAVVIVVVVVIFIIVIVIAAQFVVVLTTGVQLLVCIVMVIFVLVIE